MEEPDWEEYARLQAKLLENSCVNWGLEAALNHKLEHIDAGRAEVELLARTANRRERNRAVLLRKGAVAAPVVDIAVAIDNRRRAAALRRSATAAEWLLVLLVVFGYDSDEIATRLGIQPGAARVRILRVRRKLQAIDRRDRAAMAS